MRARLAALLVVAAAVVTASAQSLEPYRVLAEPQPVAADGKVEVLDFFWYGCEHCHRLEPAIEAWLPKKPKDAVFRRVPAVAGGVWNVHAHIYYTLDAMGRIDDLHGRVFDAIHKQGLRLEQAAVREKWLVAQDIDPKRYAEAEKSAGVLAKLKRAEELTRAYRLESVPMVVVHGKYVTSPAQAGSNEHMFKTVDQLVAQERKKR